jgi:hypothetical protein
LQGRGFSPARGRGLKPALYIKRKRA